MHTGHATGEHQSIARSVVQVFNQQVDVSKVVTLCKLLESLLLGSHSQVDLHMDPGKLHPFICTIFIFCYVWSIGGNIIDANWDAFDTFVRQLFEDNSDAKVTLTELILINVKLFS